MHDPDNVLQVLKIRDGLKIKNSSPNRNNIDSAHPEVIVDQGLCTSPKDCLLCLRSCSTKLFVYAPEVKEDQEEADNLHRVWCYMPEFCTMCNQCVEICPQKAITIKAAE
jgi:ferredoxin